MLTRSAKSLVTLKSLSEEDVQPEQSKEKDTTTPTTVFEDLLPYLLKKFHCTFDVYVRKAFLSDPLNNKKSANSSAKTKEKSVPRNIPNKDEIEMSRLIPTSSSPDVVILTALYDKYDELIEVLIDKQKSVPRMLFQVMSVVASLYDMLTKITIKRCRIDSNTIHELKNNIDTMFLTEICLDGSFVPEANYAVLLEKQSTLTYLSLCRCWINDEVCETIVSKLHYQAVAEKQMLTLHLSGNLITDIGAESISKMLRSNRHLRYLNLAGNRLSDEGASLILEALREFRLTLNENNNRRMRIMHYMKRKNKLVSKLLTECVLGSDSPIDRDGDIQLLTTKREKKAKDIRVHVALNRCETAPDLVQSRLQQADASATLLIGQDNDPFGVGKVVLKDGWAHCKGNFSLCYLNLAFNDLTHFSVKNVLDLLLYQQDIDRHIPKEPGLVKIVIKGNLIPETCTEYAQINEIISKNVIVDNNIGKKRQSMKKTSSTASRTSVPF